MGAFLGTGWSFPPGTDGRGGITLVSGAEDIEQAVWIILSTPTGSRVMRPTFGSRLHELVFAPTNAHTLGLAELYTADALSFWEPRIEIVDVIASAPPEQPNVLLIQVDYKIKSTHDRRSLVYPFYQLPGE